MTELKAGASGAMPEGIVEGESDADQVGYLEPCPPEGQRHQYFFTVLAMNDVVEENPELTLTEFEQEHASKVIARGSLLGTYER